MPSERAEPATETSGGLKLRDVARLLDVHENTIPAMLRDGRLRSYTTDSGQRFVVAASVREYLQRGVETVLTCQFCERLLDQHTAMTIMMAVNGKAVLTPVGWACPTKESAHYRPKDIA